MDIGGDAMRDDGMMDDRIDGLGDGGEADGVEAAQPKPKFIDFGDESQKPRYPSAKEAESWDADEYV